MKEERYRSFIQNCIHANSLSSNNDVWEKHHIIPKCLGGPDSDSNLAKLTPRQHYIAHAMLAKIYPKNLRIQQAFWIMIHGTDKHKRHYKSTLYELLKKRRSELMKGIMPEQFKEHNPAVRNTELFSGKIRVFDLNNPNSASFWVSKEELLSNKNLVAWSKGTTIAYDKLGNKSRVEVTDKRLQDGSLISLGKKIATNNKGTNNASFKGFYSTPLGIFATSLEAAERHGIHWQTIIGRCVTDNDKKIIHPNSIRRSSDLKTENFDNFKGKSWNELGWSFIPDTQPK
ncbi:MAG: HNH endonuclease signature motif containing protein [Aeromonas popoffii]|uniref:HNH endonuclease signature motif containing protein n=1 Tax=Aeromonas popoffii TaxID=70856 RepID=UPI003F3ACEE2